MDKKNKLIILPGIKENSSDTAYIEVNGDRIALKSVILAGENSNGQRVILTWNCSCDELAANLKSLELAINYHISQNLNM